MSLYFILLLGSVAVPLVLSFDKKLQFYKQWKFVFPSIFIVAIFYILADITLTKWGVWGFNPRYLSGIQIVNLPLEEWLFFIVIPYASIFLHESFVLYFPKMRLSNQLSSQLSLIIIFIALAVSFFNYDKIYTFYLSVLVVIATSLSLLDKTRLINSYYISFLLILIPFLIVNAILTGSFIENEVVWYDNNENLGVRFLTIPIEDFGYAFSMILFNLLLISKFKQLFGNKPKLSGNAE